MLDTIKTVPTKTVPTNFNEKKLTCKTRSFFILKTFLLITITLLIVVNIYSYLIKHQANKNIYYYVTSQITNSNRFFVNRYIINMKSNHKLSDLNIKNCTYYYFYNIIKTENFDFDNILLDGNLYGNVWIYEILSKTLIDAKPVHIRFNKVDGFIIVYNENRHLLLFIPEKYNIIYNRIRYLISLESSIIYFS